jgi:hypothetical protein
MKFAILWSICALIGLHLKDLRADTWAVEAERAFAEGSRNFEGGDYESALKQFRLAQDAGMRTASVAYNIGVCQYHTADYAGSEQTFRRISLDYPDMRSLANYNLGLALYRQHRRLEARLAFLTAESGDDASLAQLASAMLLRIAEEPRAETYPPRTAGYDAFVEAGIGYDDNLVLLDESNISIGETTDSAFGEFFGRFGGTAGSAANFRYDASAYLVHYPDADRFNQSVLRLGGEWSSQVRNWRVAAAPYYAYSTLDGDGYDQRVGFGVSALRQLTPVSQFAILLVHEEIGDLDSRYAFIEGSRQLIGLRFHRHNGPHRASLRYDFSIDDRVSASVSPTRHSFRAGYRHEINEDWTAGVEATLRSSDYDDLSEPRDEDLGELALVLFRSLSPKWQLTGEYRYSSNDSNISAFAYQRHRVTVGLNRIF